MTVIKDRHNKDTDIGKDELIIDKIDCLQRDFAGFKKFIIEHMDEKFDNAVTDIKKRKQYVEPGYR